MGILERKGRRSFFPKCCRFFCEKSSVLKKRGNSRGGEALGVAKPVSPPHTPPLRARHCVTPWRMLIYRLSPVCCCIGGVRRADFFVPPDGKAARAAGLFPVVNGSGSMPVMRQQTGASERRQYSDRQEQVSTSNTTGRSRLAPAIQQPPGTGLLRRPPSVRRKKIGSA